MNDQFRVQSSDSGVEIQNSKFKIQNSKTDLKKATKEFEAFFLNYLLKTMRESIPKDGLFGGGTGEDIYTSMLDENLAKEMAKKGGIGIGGLLLKQLEQKP